MPERTEEQARQMVLGWLRDEKPDWATDAEWSDMQGSEVAAHLTRNGFPQEVCLRASPR